MGTIGIIVEVAIIVILIKGMAETWRNW